MGWRELTTRFAHLQKRRAQRANEQRWHSVRNRRDQHRSVQF
jgi:hypothetical protein